MRQQTVLQYEQSELESELFTPAAPLSLKSSYQKNADLIVQELNPTQGQSLLYRSVQKIAKHIPVSSNSLYKKLVNFVDPSRSNLRTLALKQNLEGTSERIYKTKEDKIKVHDAMKELSKYAKEDDFFERVAFKIAGMDYIEDVEKRESLLSEIAGKEYKKFFEASTLVKSVLFNDDESPSPDFSVNRHYGIDPSLFSRVVSNLGIILLASAGVIGASHYLIKPVSAQSSSQTYVSVDSPLLKNPVTVDGKYTTPDEYPDAAVKKVMCDPPNADQVCAVMKTKHDATTQFTLFEILYKNSFSAGDYINLVFGIKDVRGSFPTPDHLLMVYQVNQNLSTPDSTVSSKAATAFYGENMRWPSVISLSYEVFPQWAAGLHSSPESPNPHQIWEIATPLNGHYSNNPSCNPNNLSSQPFDALFLDRMASEYLSFTNPSKHSDNYNPNLYGVLNYGTVPIPEFQNIIALLTSVGLVPVFMRRKKKRQEQDEFNITTLN